MDMDLSKRIVTGYAVFTGGRTQHEGDTKTLRGARSKSAALTRRGLSAQIIAYCTDGTWTWNEFIA